jgi:hypothetical protein
MNQIKVATTYLPSRLLRATTSSRTFPAGILSARSRDEARPPGA